MDNGDARRSPSSDAGSDAAVDADAAVGSAAVGAGPAAGLEDCYAIIPAGGVGSRLWPLSRGDRPKYLFDLLGQGRTLIQSTYDRVSALFGAGHISMVVGARHVDPILEQLPELPAGSVIAEPVARDSGPAIALAAAIIARRHGPDAIVASFAADQVIHGLDGFGRSVREAAAVARAGYVATIGIAASRPSTAFGYIRQGESLARLIDGAPSARMVERFVEKPDAVTAQRYLATGEYRWNAGMFVMRADVLLRWLRDTRPHMYETVSRIAEARVDSHGEMDEVIAGLWPGVEKIAFDYAVAEPMSLQGGVAVVSGDFGWDDVGDFSSVATLLPGSASGNIRILGDHGNVVALDCAEDVVVSRGGRVVALLGVDDLIVADTPDALMVAPRARSQDVRRLVDFLRARGHGDVL